MDLKPEECNNLFKLPYPYGVINGKDDDFVVADTTHEIMSLIAPSIILQNWNPTKSSLRIEALRSGCNKIL